MSCPDVSHHPAEGHRRSGGDVRGHGSDLYMLPEKPGSHALGKLRLPVSQKPGLLGQRPDAQDLLYPGWLENTDESTHMHVYCV